MRVLVILQGPAYGDDRVMNTWPIVRFMTVVQSPSCAEPAAGLFEYW